MRLRFPSLLILVDAVIADSGLSCPRRWRGRARSGSDGHPARTRRQAGPVGDLAGPEHGGVGHSGSFGPEGCARRSGRRRRQRDPISAVGAGQEERELRTARHAGPGNQVLPAGRAAPHVHAVSIPDHPEAERADDPVRVRARRSLHLHERHAASSGPDRLVARRFARPLGGRHARGRRDPFQRSDVVRQGRQFPQRCAAPHGTLHADRSRSHHATPSRSTIPRCSRGPGT